MSAFICEEYHIGRLAAYLVHQIDSDPRFAILFPKAAERIDAAEDEAALIGPVLGPAQVAALALANANLASIEARYGEHHGMHAEGDTDTSYRVACVAESRRGWCGEHSHADMFLAAKCFEYQACGYDGWRASEAREMVVTIRELAGSALARAESDVWSLRKPEGPQTILLSSLFRR